MNNVQKTIFRKYLFLTMLILIFDHLFPGQPFVRCFKFAVVLSLFLTATRIKGKKKREIILHAALFFTVLGDFFLDFCQLTSWFGELIPFGLLCFGVAYLLLISVFYQKSRPGKREKLIFFGVTGSLIFTFFNLFAYFDRRLFLPLIIFGLILGGMSWTLISLPFRTSSRKQFTYYPALSGLFILISDLAVAHALFNPAFKGCFVPWLENIIWATFIPAWTLLVLILAEDKVNMFLI